jgi:hypothetical protein
MIQINSFTKKPAFFPAVNVEVFFEAENARESGALKLDTLDSNLDAELDRILGMANMTSAQGSVSITRPASVVDL